MSHSDPISRRSVLAGGAVLAVGAGLTGCVRAVRASGQTEGISYFSRFGIDEALLHATLAAAMSRGADAADVFIQHRVLNSLSLEDNTVNRANSSVELGAGVRVIKGDQQGYAYTEELTLESLARTAKAAAAIAKGPAREVPQRFKIETKRPGRYALSKEWDQVDVAQKRPLLSRIKAAAYETDKLIVKVNVHFTD
ncbi:MAG: PmbA/TldA family metallopeptidase, partial [Myxococcaceae bacterium]